MQLSPNRFLIAGAALSGVAALAHLGCIFFGASWYRFLGAGEPMAQMASTGHWYPAAVTSAIVVVLLIWALYALSGAGVIRKLPLLRVALCTITAIYLLRGLAFVLLMPIFPGNSLLFWLVSSGICLAFGIVHFAGMCKAWAHL
ncbi:hypothetical protein [Paraherbaspirillum soli]|uniref:Uncharacterized protein n=1 Tax=Paraherbaspirillum soli TaxID=631222 RepID=A0ABW0M858_9BURK